MPSCFFRSEKIEEWEAADKDFRINTAGIWEITWKNIGFFAVWGLIRILFSSSFRKEGSMKTVRKNSCQTDRN